MIDSEIKFNLDLARLDAHTRAEVIKILKRMRKELLAELNSGKQLTEWNKARIDKLFKDAGAIIDDYYTQAHSTITEVLDGIAPVAATATQTALIAAVPVLIDINMPTDNYLKQLAGNTIIQGATIKEWSAKQSEDVLFKFMAQVRQGLIAAEDNQKIISRVTQALDISRRDAAALVQTSVQTVANEARMAVFDENQDIIKAYIYLATLDSHTCTRCAPYDGRRWDTEYKPIGHHLPFKRLPQHFSCRCVVSIQTKSFAELGAPEIPEPIPGKRASSDGPVSDKTTFESFLKRQDKAFIENTLGKGRAELWQKGKITLSDLIDGQGRELSLQELIDKYK